MAVRRYATQESATSIASRDTLRALRLLACRDRETRLGKLESGEAFRFTTSTTGENEAGLPHQGQRGTVLGPGPNRGVLVQLAKRKEGRTVYEETEWSEYMVVERLS